MSKNRKGKIIQLKSAPLSPEKYIQTQARSLPIAECLINEDWQSVGVCHIIVARRHKTGNITAGLYLVDLHCLGLKDSFYEFNLDPEDYQDLKSDADWQQCQYTLAHNIIYGAIDFAEDYGFKPSKDFSVSRFILEEDDENVELMEIEFGLDGMPCYIQRADDDQARLENIKSTLTRTAGPGNFAIINHDDQFEDDIDEQEQEELLFEEEEKAFKSFIRAFKKINKAYDELIRTPQGKPSLRKSPIGTNYSLSAKTNYYYFDDAALQNEYNRLSDIALIDEDYELAITETIEAIKKHPDKPAFYNILQFAYTFNDQFQEAEQVIQQAYTLHPDYLFAKIYYANQLIDQGRSSEVLSVFNQQADLDQIYPGRRVFSPGEAAAYYACMCRYFVDVDDIDAADLYMDAIFKKRLTESHGQTVLKVAIDELCQAKMEKMKNLVG